MMIIVRMLIGNIALLSFIGAEVVQLEMDWPECPQILRVVFLKLPQPDVGQCAFVQRFGIRNQVAVA